MTNTPPAYQDSNLIRINSPTAVADIRSSKCNYSHDNAEAPTMKSTDNENNQKDNGLLPAYQPPRFSACSAALLRKWISRRLPDNEDMPASLPVINGCDIEYVMVDGECMRIGGGEGADAFLCRMKASQELVALKLNKLNAITMSAFVFECDLQQRMNDTGKSAVLHGVVAMKVSKAYMRLGMVSEFIGNVTTYKVQSLAKLMKNGIHAMQPTPQHQDMTKLNWMHMCLDLVECIRECHRVGIVFGDLKANNILFCRRFNRWVPILVDFRLSGLHERAIDVDVPGSFAEGSIDKYLYLPPEYIHEKKVTMASDVYALGMLLDTIGYMTDLRLDAITKTCCMYSASERVDVEQLYEMMQWQLRLLELMEES